MPSAIGTGLEVTKARLEEDGGRGGGKGEVSKARLEEDGGKEGVK